MPRSPRARAKSETSLIGVPHAALSRPSFSPMPVSSPRSTTSPRMPLSATRMFVPPPRRHTGIPASAACLAIAAAASGVPGTAKSSAGPPMRKLVCPLIGSPSRTSPNALIFPANSRTFATRKIVLGGLAKVYNIPPDGYSGEPRVELRLFNTMGRRVETFVPLQEGKAGMYACGLTVYNYAHVGNLRTFIFEDVLRRTLRVRRLRGAPRDERHRRRPPRRGLG